jgi:hypothetical protein
MRLFWLLVALACAVVYFGPFGGLASAQNMSGMGRIADPPPAPYTRADFQRDCIAMAPRSEPARREWITKTCRKEAP